MSPIGLIPSNTKGLIHPSQARGIRKSWGYFRNLKESQIWKAGFLNGLWFIDLITLQLGIKMASFLQYHSEMMKIKAS
jgi:hypothetical protein